MIGGLSSAINSTGKPGLASGTKHEVDGNGSRQPKAGEPVPSRFALDLDALDDRSDIEIGQGTDLNGTVIRLRSSETQATRTKK